MIENFDYKSQKILIVEDREANLKMLGSYLSKKYNVAFATNGEEALQVAKKYHPDLTLMDINMPVMDGYEAIENFKNDIDIPDHPIIITTALSDINNINKGFEKGAVDYVIKPFDMDNLDRRIEVHLKLKLTQNLLEKKNEQLEKLINTKDKFFSIVAHDIRSPLAGILNLTSFFADEFERMSTKDILGSLKKMVSSLKLLFKFIDNLLDWSRIQGGKIEFKPTLISLQEIIENNIELVKNNADNKNINIYFETKNIEVYSDPNILDTIIRNLLSNAVKFTNKSGQINILLEDSDMVKLSIKDNGIGISPEIKEKIFRIDKNNTTLGTNNEKGTGLGLILVKDFVELQGGTIDFESEPNVGTTFWFTIPKNKI